MKICWFGIYDPEYSRNKILIGGLKENTAEIIECNVRGVGLGKYFALIKQLRDLSNEYDFLYCAFPVHISIIFARIFQKKPIIVDAFVSKYDSAVNDRKTTKKYYPKAWWYYLLDYLMIKFSDHVIVDTEQHKKYWKKWKRESNINVLPVGVHTKEFFPIVSSKKVTDKFLVQFHGSYIPLQGVDKIVEAVRLLQNKSNIAFRFIGSGQTYKAMRDLVAHYGLDIEFIPWLSIQELNQKLNEADVILGIFGDTDKTDRVIPNKLYQGLAVGKPVITKDTPAVREQFNGGELLLVSNEPKDIAKAIVYLYEHPNQCVERGRLGYARVVKDFNQVQLGKKLYEILKTSM